MEIVPMHQRLQGCHVYRVHIYSCQKLTCTFIVVKAVLNASGCLLYLLKLMRTGQAVDFMPLGMSLVHACLQLNITLQAKVSQAQTSQGSIRT